ncbi:Asparagine synthetase [Eumeta japonica]|uniref:Asparagine synthetase n=1 Tax=Eumeta variegata TaxID=151549 RepID=A0A4C2AGJ5_EUMVA|nr:Asparagine synthetase [Eumeta japonica]
MCGIWAIFGVEDKLSTNCIKHLTAIVHRGPDACIEQDARVPAAILGFRLAIVDGLHVERADEVAQGYIYFRDAPSPEDAHQESIRLLSDIYIYMMVSVLTHTTSAFSLELRTFLRYTIYIII